jgi:carbamoyltransferase
VYTLGINAAFHDPAACLVRDGRVVAAAEEERFTRIKHGKRPIPFSAYELPFHAIDFCLRRAGIALIDVDHVAYSYDPFIRLGDQRESGLLTLPLEPSAHPQAGEPWESPWDPLFLSHIVNAPRHLMSGAPHRLRARFKGASLKGPYRWHFVPHHLAHAASAFHASPFKRAAVLTLDGQGEIASTSYHLGVGIRLEPLGQVNMPHSLGMLYEEVTSFLGFQHSADEYKVMALASYGQPSYAEHFRDIVRLHDHGQYTVDWTRLRDRLGPPRPHNAPLNRHHYDIARSLQLVLEETVLDLVGWLHAETDASALCMAGGVALNCVLNARIRDRGPFRQVWVQPAAGDAGTALGAALWTDAGAHEMLPARTYIMEHAYLGPVYSDAEIEASLCQAKVSYRRLADVAQETAAILAEDKIIGWFQGAMEFGPRALGARSILASPISVGMQKRLNALKDREDFRPVAPVVLEEEASEWFADARPSPFMLFVYDVLPERAGRIPAVRHTDGTARIQTVNRAQHPLYYDLLKAFQARTGVPILVNTSFNSQGRPIVCCPRDALECFWTTPLDGLVIGPFLLQKK